MQITNPFPAYRKNLSKFSHLTSLLLLIAAFLQVVMILRFEINWDEFFLLDLIYKSMHGEFTSSVSGIYYRFFNWLPSVSQNEVDQIIAARGVMFVCAMISCTMVFFTCRRFFSLEASLLALLALVSFSAFFRHGTSFRSDTIAVALLTTATYLATAPKLSVQNSLATGLLIGLSGMITIKSIFLALMIGTILLIKFCFAEERKPAFFQALIVAGSSIVFFATFYTLHSSWISVGKSGFIQVNDVLSYALFEGGFFPKWHTFKSQLSKNPVQFLLIGFGILLLILQLITEKAEKRKLPGIILAFAIPASTLLFYNHAHAYFFNFIMAPATLIIAYSIEFIFNRQKNTLHFGLILVFGVALAIVFTRSMLQPLSYQRMVVDVVHDLFPKPVSYIDRTSMISSYDKQGLFMSQWLMTEYYKADKPIMAEIIRDHSPEFLLANIDSLELDALEKKYVKRPLFEEDIEVLKDTYIHHWGPIYVPGKIVERRDGEIKSEFNINISGVYTLESDEPVRLDGNFQSKGAILKLERGTHVIEYLDNKKVTLRWGGNLKIPEQTALERPLFIGF